MEKNKMEMNDELMDQVTGGSILPYRVQAGDCVACETRLRGSVTIAPEAAAALQCALEVTAGVKAVIGLAGPYTLPLVCGACSFGGLSLLLQNAAFWQESGLGLGPLLLARLAHGLTSAALCLAAQTIMGSLK